MQTAIKKIKTATSYTLQPHTYPFLRRLIKSKITGESLSLNRTSEQATEWCKRRTVQPDVALQQLCNQQSTVLLKDEFAEVIAEAEDRVSSRPQQMGGGRHLDLVYNLCEAFKAHSILETSVAYGWSSLAMFLSLNNRAGSRLISTNLHYSRYEDDSYVGCAVLENLRENWTLIKEADETALPKALAMMPVFDLCHYDSDKTYSGRMWAYSLLWQALKIDGCFVSDDIHDNLAFAHFCRMLRQEPTVVEVPASAGKKYVGILVKEDNRVPRKIVFQIGARASHER